LTFKIKGEVEPHESLTSQPQVIWSDTNKIKNVISRVKSSPRWCYKTETPDIVCSGSPLLRLRCSWLAVGWDLWAPSSAVYTCAIFHRFINTRKWYIYIFFYSHV